MKNKNILKEKKHSKKEKGEEFNKMSSENKYFWGLFIICFFDILFLITNNIEPFYWGSIISHFVI